VKNRKAHISEPDVDRLLSECTLKVGTLDDVAAYADVIFVVVPTPSLPDGTFSNEHIRDVITNLPKRSLNVESLEGPIVALVSTVSPGSFTGPGNLNELTRSRGYHLVYTPTLIALGTVIHDLIEPDVQMVGIMLPTPDDGTWNAYNIIVQALESIIIDSPIIVTDFESAALAKLASNVFVTMKIGFANVLAQACDKINGNVTDVTYILGLNRRIGAKSLAAGAGYGGPCFPRDAAAFAAVDPMGSVGMIGHATQRINQRHLHYVIREIKRAVVKADATFAVLGHNYKEGSAYEIESFGANVADHLKLFFEEVHASDADVVVIAQPLRDTDLSPVIRPGAYVYDLWGAHRYLAERGDVAYKQLGRVV
jgi:UDPglucose 6-dehydrogenase